MSVIIYLLIYLLLSLCYEIELIDNVVLISSVQQSAFSSIQLLSHVQFFATPWTTACQASLCIINSQSLPRLMSFESVMPSNHLHPLLSPSALALYLSQH